MTYYDDWIKHYGVKGMKWGVRKKKGTPKVRTKSDTIHAKTKNGEELIIGDTPVPKFTRFLAARNKKIRENVNNSQIMTIKDKKGSKVGQLQLFQETPKSVNVVWVAIDDKSNGKGYGTAVMNATINYAKKKGNNKVTLEVPGNAPNARHIYEKLGFVNKGSISSDDDSWGGLTAMELNLKRG